MILVKAIRDSEGGAMPTSASIRTALRAEDFSDALAPALPTQEERLRAQSARPPRDGCPLL